MTTTKGTDWRSGVGHLAQPGMYQGRTSSPLGFGKWLYQPSKGWKKVHIAS